MDLELVSSLARVRNSEILFQSNVCNAGDLAAVRVNQSVRYSGGSLRRDLTLIVKYPEFEDEKAYEDDNLTFIKVLKNV